VQQIDQLFARALAAGELSRDPSLNLPPPPILELPPETAPAENQSAAGNAYQVQISGKDVNVYNFAMAHLRTLTGVDSAVPQQINPTGTSYVLVTYHGDISQLAAALRARGWQVDFSGTVVQLRSSSDKPPALPPPPQATPAPAQPPATAPAQPPASGQPAQQ
jgi:hypothetical protein